ncbi:MAG TPA: BadF/BadG/BcrA/BcrD ATPase family protein [Roseiarcus sp.]|nr:BadF/BadG/BcrA/BcrD ATPase family protein [Roseiarcus sp.]
METPADELYFCVDGGGSRSRGRLLNFQGGTLAEAAAGPCNPATNLEKALASIASLWSQCCATVGRQDNQFDAVVLAIGAAGTYIEVDRENFLAACPPFARIVSISDGYAALIGAGSGAPCSLIIIGTGIAGHRLYENGLSIQRDAWGWIAGDRGSGSWMGQKALRHCLAALDGVVPQDELSRAVLKAIGGVDKLRAGWMKNLGPDRLAAFAPLVLEHANAGDAMALRIRRRAVEHLAALIGVIADPDTPLYAAGGLVQPLHAFLSEKAGRPILEPKGDALTGCWLVASGRAPVERVLLFGETAEQA